eukprot:gene10591-451_t
MSDFNINLQGPQNKIKDEFSNLPPNGLHDMDSVRSKSEYSADGSYPPKDLAAKRCYLAAKRKTKLCSLYEIGLCRAPKEKCNFAHGDSDLICLKLKMCEFWKRGYCNRANKCRYAHGVKELGDVFKKVSYPPTFETSEVEAQPSEQARLKAEEEAKAKKAAEVADLLAASEAKQAAEEDQAKQAADAAAPPNNPHHHAAAPPNNPHHHANYNYPSVPYQGGQEVIIKESKATLHALLAISSEADRPRLELYLKDTLDSEAQMTAALLELDTVTTKQPTGRQTYYDENKNLIVKHNGETLTYPPKAGVLIFDNSEKKVLAVQGSKWGLPKGQIEENECAFECAKRELLEETGFNLCINESDRYIKISNTIYYLFKALNDLDTLQPNPSNKIDEWEIIQSGFVKINDLLSLNCNAETKRALTKELNYAKNNCRDIMLV